MIGPLKQRSFLMLFIAQIFSDMGNWFDFIALNLIIAYRWKLGADALALKTIAYGLPWILLGPVLNVYADRLPKKRIMLLCLALRISVIIGMIFAPNIICLISLVLIKETLGALYDPAQQGAIQMLVSRELLPEANSLSQISSNFSKIIVPFLGGLLISISGPTTVFLIEGAGFFIATILISRLFIQDETSKNVTMAKQTIHNFRMELKSSLLYIKTKRIVKSAVFLCSVRIFLIFLWDSLLILWAKNMAVGESGFGILVSAGGLGSIIGSVIAGQWKVWVKKPLSAMSLATAVSGGIVLLIGGLGYGFHSMAIHGLFLIFLLLGLAGSVIPVAYGYIIQAEVSPDVIGKVVGTANAIQNLFMLSAPLLGASLSKVIGLNSVLMIAGFAMGLLGIFVFIREKLTFPPSNESNSVI